MDLLQSVHGLLSRVPPLPGRRRAWRQSVRGLLSIVPPLIGHRRAWRLLVGLLLAGWFRWAGQPWAVFCVLFIFLGAATTGVTGARQVRAGCPSVRVVAAVVTLGLPQVSQSYFSIWAPMGPLDPCPLCPSMWGEWYNRVRNGNSPWGEWKGCIFFQGAATTGATGAGQVRAGCLSVPVVAAVVTLGLPRIFPSYFSTWALMGPLDPCPICPSLWGEWYNRTRNRHSLWDWKGCICGVNHWLLFGQCWSKVEGFLQLCWSSRRCRSSRLSCVHYKGRPSTVSLGCSMAYTGWGGCVFAGSRPPLLSSPLPPPRLVPPLLIRLQLT